MAVRELVAVRGIEKTDDAFRRELIAMSDRIGLNPDYMAAVMSFETAGSFDPAQKNLGGGSAVGLIQFMPTTAKGLGTTRADLMAMGPVEQLAFVEKYMKRAGKLRTLSDHYMAVFAPIGIGKPPGFPLYRSPSRAYKQNKALDREGDGVISVSNATIPPANILAAGMSRPRIVVDMGAGKGSDPGPVGNKDLFTPTITPVGRTARKLLPVAGVALLAYAAAVGASRRTKKAGNGK